jgi:hypothetical protein
MSAAGRLLTVLAGGASALALSACGGFDSAASGEHLIHDYVTKFGRGKVALTSASCPSGVKQTTGGSYTCQVVLREDKSGLQHTGTITVHMLAGNKVSIDGSRDVHIR